MNQIVASVPFYNPRWCDDCYNERVNAIREVCNIYIGDIYAQGEREGWGTERIEDAVERCYDQKHKELELFYNAIVEAEERDEMRYRRGLRNEGMDEETRASEEVSDDGDEGRECDATRGDELDVAACYGDDSSESESESEDCEGPSASGFGFRIRGSTGRTVSLAEDS